MELKKSVDLLKAYSCLFSHTEVENPALAICFSKQASTYFNNLIAKSPFIFLHL